MGPMTYCSRFLCVGAFLGAIACSAENSDTEQQEQSITTELESELARIGVVPSSEWGARANRCTSSDPEKYRITIHHTAEEVGANNFTSMLRDTQNYHMDSNGWCDIGYHFIITVDGRIWQARPLDHSGAHVANQNQGNIGISLAGCFDDDPYCAGKLPREPTPAMQAATERLVHVLAKEYEIALDSESVKGHRDHNPGTVCPGDYVYQTLDTVRSNSMSEIKCGLIPREGGIVDESGACFQRFGGASGWRWTGEGQQNSLVWTYAYTGDIADNYARWNLGFQEKGLYQVEVHIPAGSADVNAIPYTLSHASGESEIIVDQSTVNGWHSLGEFEFSTDAGQWLRLDDNTSVSVVTATARIAFDSVRLTRIGGTDADAGPGSSSDAGTEDGRESDGGCNSSTSGSSTGLVFLFLALGLTLRRRKQF